VARLAGRGRRGSARAAAVDGCLKTAFLGSAVTSHIVVRCRAVRFRATAAACYLTFYAPTGPCGVIHGVASSQIHNKRWRSDLPGGMFLCILSHCEYITQSRVVTTSDSVIQVLRSCCPAILTFLGARTHKLAGSLS